MEEKNLIAINPIEYGLDLTKGEAIAVEFLPFKEELEELINEYQKVEHLSLKEPKNAKVFDELRKKFKKIKPRVSEKHAQEKESIVKAGKFIDFFKNRITQVAKEYESLCEEKATWLETQEKIKKENIRKERESALLNYEYYDLSADFSTMPDNIWENFLEGVKIKFLEMKAKREKEEMEEQIRLENERIEKENEEKRIKEEQEEKSRLQKIHNERQSRLLDYWSFVPEDMKTVAYHSLTEDEFDYLLKISKEKKEKHEVEQEQIIKEMNNLRKIQEAKDAEIKLLLQEQEFKNQEIERLKQEEIKIPNQEEVFSVPIKSIPDYEKINNYIRDLKLIKLPDLETEKYKLKWNEFVLTMRNAITKLTKG